MQIGGHEEALKLAPSNEEKMSYVDASLICDSDIILVVERKDGKRQFRIPTKYTFYYKDERGKYKSVYGDPSTRIVCKNTQDFPKNLQLTKAKNYLKVM